MRTTRWLWLTGALLGTGALVAGVHIPQAAGMPPAALAQGGTSAEANKAGTENPTAYPAQSGDPEPESLRTLALRHVLGIGMGQRLRIGKLSVYYLDPVTEQQALTVGDFLSRSDLGQHEGLIHLQKRSPARRDRGDARSHPVFAQGRADRRDQSRLSAAWSAGFWAGV
jgi:hypothetical protein